MKKGLLYLSMLFLAFVCNVTPVNAQVVEVLKDVNPGDGSSVTSTWMTNHNGKLFFAADDGPHGMELWVSDGTDAGTTLLKDIRPGIDGSYAGYASNRNNKFAVCNNKLFFLANDGVHGIELWATDGSEEGTYLVKDIGVGETGGLQFAKELYTYNGKVYFCAMDEDPYFGTEYSGQELWCSDGTEEGTYLIKDIMPNSSNYGSSGSNPQRFMEFNGMLYFVAYDGGQGVNGGHSSELWVTDGTEEGTHLFKDIAQEYYNETPSQLTVCGDLMFFTTRVGIYGTELWATDGTEEGTYMVKDIYPGEIVPGMPWHGNPTFLTNYNGTLFFQAWDEDGSCLWKSDGTENGTVKLSSVVHKPVNLKVYGDQIIFLAYDGGNSSNYELYSWSETAGVQLVKEINPSPTSGIDFMPDVNFPEGFVQYKDKLYFRAADDGYATTIWQTDGTEGGTIVAPGQENYTYPDAVSPMYIMEFDFNGFNGSLYYPAGYEDNPAFEVYKLTVAPIEVYAVIGGGDFCQGDEGLPVGLSGSEEGVTYTLFKNGVALTPTIEGTGEAISFGNQTAGTYTVSGANVAGVLEMEGSAVVNTATSIPVSVSIVAEDEEVCAGVHVTFTATPVNGGIYPDYLWYVNGEELGEGPTYSYFSWIPGEFEIYAKLTSSFSCAANVALSNVITLTINEFVTPEVTIAASENPVYSANPVTFTPTPVNGGTPSYEWFVNSVLVGTDNTYAYLPINEDQVYVVMTSSVECASATTAQSNVIEMIVNNGIPAAYSVTGGGNYCEGSGGLPVGVSDSEIGVLYTLYKDGVAQTPTVEGTGEALSFGNQLGGVYTVTGTNVNTTTTMAGSAVIVELENLPVSVYVEPDHEPICSNSTIVFNAYAENVGDAPTFQWYKNGIAVEGFNFNQYQFVPIEGDEVYVVVTSSLECTINNPATSEVYELDVLPMVTAEVSIQVDSNNVCEGTSVTFTATPVNGGDEPEYFWYLNDFPAGSNQPVFTYEPSNGDYINVVMVSDPDFPCVGNGGAESNYIFMTVNEAVTPAVSISASENPVNEGSPVTFTPTPVNGGTPTYQWFVNGAYASDVTPYTYTPEDGDQVYAEMASSLECITADIVVSNTILMDVITSININDIPGVKVYSFDKVIYLESTTSLSGEAVVYDVAGRKLITRTLLNETKTLIPASSLTNGVYIVKISNGVSQFNTRVFIR